MDNALTVDVEDYFQVAAFARQIDPATWNRIPLRVERNTQRLLDLFAEQSVQAAGMLESAIGRLMVVVENYPDLKANQNFLDLQTQLEGTENRINVARQRYNQAVEAFNSAIRKFPASLTNSLLLHLDRKQYFKADEQAKGVPAVKF